MITSTDFWWGMVVSSFICHAMWIVLTLRFRGGR